MLAKSNSLKFNEKLEALRKMRETNTNSKMVNHIKHTEIVAIIDKTIPNEIVEMESVIEMKLKLLSAESNIEKVLALSIPCA